MSKLDELLKEIPSDYDEVDVANHLLHFRDGAIIELSLLRSQIEILKTKLEIATEVIRPFAAESEMWGSKTPDTETPFIRGSDGKGDEAAFTVGDLREAANFLK